MKKYILMLACIASGLFVSSCSNDETPNNATQKIIKKTFVVSSPSSRAYIADINDLSPDVLWNQVDEIKVWGRGNTNGVKFNFLKIPNSIYKNYAAFEGTITPADKYYLMYPYQADATFDGSEYITATIPTVQKATPNSFDPNAAICVGATMGAEDQSVAIDHACAFLKITTKNPCKSITVTSKHTSWYLSGKVTMDPKSAGTPITGFPAGVNNVKLTADGTDGCSSTFAAGTYLIAIIPTTSGPGFDVSVVDENDNTLEGQSTRPQFVTGKIVNLGTVEKITTSGND